MARHKAQFPTLRSSAPVAYAVKIPDAARHYFEVELTIAEPSAAQRVSLPAWIPGSYLIREFARHLHSLRATQGRSNRLYHQLDKATWEIECDPHKPLVLRYSVYAFDTSVRTAWLDTQRGFFNGTSVLLRVHGLESRVHQLTVHAPPGLSHWQLASAMTPVQVDSRGFGTYRANNYEEVVDHPVEMGDFWSCQFKACDVMHRLVVAGAPAAFDGKRLVRDTQKICETIIRFWHGKKKPPISNYVFLLNAVDEDYGGLEHRASTALICERRDLPRVPSGLGDDQSVGAHYSTLLGLICHEYFHTWNVKRLRPAEFTHYDFERENYTRLLWFFEGFTSYYDDLLLLRAGVINEAEYFKLLTKTANQVMQSPGRLVQSAAQASYDTWIRYYRADENTPNSTISYYSKGALVALCFDLTLRQESTSTLDDVMRALWQRCRGGPMIEADFAAVMAELGGRSFSREIEHWVHGTTELPVKLLLQNQGVQVREEPSQWAQALGLRVNEDAHGIRIKLVLAASPAASAGMAAGDEWLGIEVPAASPVSPKAATSNLSQPQGWRLTRVDDLAMYTGRARTVTAWVARDKKLLKLPLTLPTQSTTWRFLPRSQPNSNTWPAR